MKRAVVAPIIAVVACLIAVLLLSSCGPSSNDPSPTISASVEQNTLGQTVLRINGSGFDSTTPNCVRLVLLGLPPPEAVMAISAPQCTGGSFKNFLFPIRYVGCEAPQGQQQVVVTGTNPSTLAIAASQTTLLVPWAADCGLAGFCGGLGQFPCPSGCISGVESGAICAPCGGEGQPVCRNDVCNSDPPGLLHPTLRPKDSQPVCSATCGRARGTTPCDPRMGHCVGSPPVLEDSQPPCVETQEFGTNKVEVFHCYSQSMISGTSPSDCVCIPNTQNNCQENSSVGDPAHPTSGQCVRGNFSHC